MSYDISLCTGEKDGKTCNKRDKCLRSVIYQRIKEHKTNSNIWVEKPQSEEYLIGKCPLFYKIDSKWGI